MDQRPEYWDLLYSMISNGYEIYECRPAGCKRAMYDASHEHILFILQHGRMDTIRCFRSKI